MSRLTVAEGQMRELNKKSFNGCVVATSTNVVLGKSCVDSLIYKATFSAPICKCCKDFFLLIYWLIHFLHASQNTGTQNVFFVCRMHAENSDCRIMNWMEN